MGGLTVARAVRARLPEAELVYAADTAAFPYGDWAEPLLVRRILSVMERLVEAVRPDAVVVACNTASTLALQPLRARFDIPFVGTVPAIKPAAEQTRSGVIGVLATPGTVRRDYTRALIDTYAYHCTVVVHGSSGLARLAEAKLQGHPPARDALRREIRSVYKRRGGGRTDVVVLGCTHYPLLLPELEAASPWPVTFIDPASAIARRVAQLLENGGAPGASGADIAADTVIVTSPVLTAETFEAYARFGFTAHRELAIAAAGRQWLDSQ
ncbi:glutamate racemase [Kaustia mangrovi]|uniref:Glutamate racemase n=2 Tax=Kaustia mangrovi TaxID=2593653 RepID=A0A7S8C8P9_9HYPH|nr:glutamate racemase [Kaustia mangrovi]